MPRLIVFLIAMDIPLKLFAAMGTNLSQVADYMTERPFVDIAKTMREWTSNPSSGGPWGSGGPFAGFTSEGIPFLSAGQVADSLVCTHGHCPPGTYNFYYEGDGTILITGGGTVVSEQPGRKIVNMTGNRTSLRITANNPINPLRNIRFIMPGFENTYHTNPFHPDFLSTWENMDVLRFMDWQRTNNSSLIDWSERTTPDHFTQAAEHGVALEYMVQLANTLDADPWFCIPHQANDNFVQQFATYVRDHLNPNRKVYIEYSNEVWNGGFSQAVYAQQQGLAQQLHQNPYQAQLYFHSKRSVEIFNIFSNVFGGNGRLVRVLASQSANSWTGEQVMDFQNAYQHADVLAIAPYIGGELGGAPTQNEISQWSVGQVLDYLRDTSIPRMITDISENLVETQSRGLGLITYEGGQHLVGTGGAENNLQLMDLFIAANRDMRMRQIYNAYLDGWRNTVGQLFTSFSSVDTPSKWGSWGVLEYQDQDIQTAPKYLALQDYINGPVTNRAPTVNAGPNQTITAPVDTVTLAGNVTDDGLPNPPGQTTANWSRISGPGNVTFGNASSLSTTATFSQPGTYVLRLTASDSALGASDDVQIVVNAESGSGSGGGANNNRIITETRIVPCSNPQDASERSRIPVCFDVKESGNVSITIYSRQGKKVRELLNGHRDAGENRMDWDLKDDAGNPISSGPYNVLFEGNGVKQKTKVVVIR